MFCIIINAIRQLALWSIRPICTEYLSVRLLNLFSNDAVDSPSLLTHGLISFSSATFLDTLSGIAFVSKSLVIFSTIFPLWVCSVFPIHV